MYGDLCLWRTIKANEKQVINHFNDRRLTIWDSIYFYTDLLCGLAWWQSPTTTNQSTNKATITKAKITTNYVFM